MLRLCTTRLASLKKVSQLAYLHQLRVFSQLRKPPTNDISIQGGLIRGHLDFVFRYVGARNTSSFIVWDNADSTTGIGLPYHFRESSDPASQACTAKLIQNDASGSDSELQLPPKRSHKFIATGQLQLSPLKQVKGQSGDIGRIGVSLKTRVKICEP